MLNVDNIFAALQIAVFGYVFQAVLLRPNYILDFYGDLLEWLGGKNRLFAWIAKPLGLCLACFTGQVAFWWWLVFEGYAQDVAVSLSKHCFFVSFAIIFAMLIKHIFEKCSRT